MIRDFFDNTQDSHNIFEGLAIMDTEYAVRINSVPVVSLTFKGCSGKTAEAMKTAIAEEVFIPLALIGVTVKCELRTYVRCDSHLIL